MQFLARVGGWVQTCSEGALPSATAELEAAIKKHQELNEEVSANYTQVTTGPPVCQSVHLSVYQAPVSLPPHLLPPQVSESGKALMDVLQRSPPSDADESAAKPDFTAATHSIMGVLHQIVQVRPHQPPSASSGGDGGGRGGSNVCHVWHPGRVTTRWRERGSIASSASTSACSCVCSSRTSDR